MKSNGRASTELPAGIIPMMRVLIVPLFACLLLVGCGTTKPASRGRFDSLTEQRTESKLRGGDQIVVRLDTGGPQPDVLEVAIDENGEISLTLIGHIKAAGLTPSELSEQIQASYVPRYYVRCTATVLPRDRFYYVGGEVRTPGRLPWSEDITLMKAINTAGGFSDFANRGKVEIVRGKGKQTFNCEDIRQHPAKDVPIQPGDTIYIPRSIF
jgi:protein involved in polysaccharide export with SLBB domain